MILYPALIQTKYCCFQKWPEYSIIQQLFSCIDEAEESIKDSQSAHERTVIRLITELPFEVDEYGDYTKHPLKGLQFK